MGVLPARLAVDLRDRLGLERAIETGTYRGSGTRRLSAVFPNVATIEIAPALAHRAQQALREVPGVIVREGSSRDVLPELVNAEVPTLYWLDGHWSGGVTGGSEDECPVLAELAAIASGHADDCILIDDARLFLAPPPPPHHHEQWPTYCEIQEAITSARPGHRVLEAHDVIVAVPEAAAADALSFAQGPAPQGTSLMRRALGRVFS